jgi:serine protease
MRRLLLVGLLGLTACPDEPIPPLPPPTSTKGTVQGTLTPFQGQASITPLTALPAFLQGESGARISKAISQALSRKQLVGVEPAARPVQEDVIPGEVIISFQEKNLSPEAALARVHVPGYTAVHKGYVNETTHLIGYEAEGFRAMMADESRALAQGVARTPGVRFAENNVRVYPFAVPTDPSYSRQWHYPVMNLPAAWDITTGSDSIVTAVIDTGIVTHPDFAPNRILQGADLISDAAAAGDGTGRDMDPTDMGGDVPNGGSSWHGTHVAGTIGAATNNGVGVAGVTWAGKILPVRVLGKQGGTLADIAAGMSWAIGDPVPGMTTNPNRAHVVNMSLGGRSQANATVQAAIDSGRAKGVVWVIAAGNANEDATGTFPCNQANVICVGSVGFDGKRSSFSNYGAPVDVMATGGEMSQDLNGDRNPDGVYSLLKGGYEYYNGTSMAAPHVAGIVALMLSANPALTPDQVESILKTTAVASSQCNEGCGTGLVNAQAAVLKAKDPNNTPNTPPQLSVASTQLSFNGSGNQSLLVRNLGGGTLQVSVTTSGTQASKVTAPASLSVPALGTAQLAVSVNGTGLPNGDHTAQLNLVGANGAGNATVQVKIRVGSVQGKDAVIAFLYEDASGEWNIDEEGIALVQASKGYAYSVPLTPRTYFVLAGIDDDGDGTAFEDGERVGFWRDTTQIEEIDLKANQTVKGVNFLLVPFDSGDEEPTEPTLQVGAACTSDAQCPGGYCDTRFTGGYCTLTCSQSVACPTGSGCYNVTDVGTICLDSCANVSECRTGYACRSTNSGGVCLD